MAIYFKPESLFSIVSHHVSIMERIYEDDHDFSIVSFKIDMSNKEIEEILRKSLRKTDIVTNIKDYYIAFLPFTDYHGAYTLLSGINKFLNQNNHETICSYPEDGKNAFQVLEKFSSKLESSFGLSYQFI